MKISPVTIISSNNNFGMAKPDYHMQKIFQKQLKRDLKANDMIQLEKDKKSIAKIVDDYFPAYDLEADEVVPDTTIIWLRNNSAKEKKMVAIYHPLAYVKSSLPNIEYDLKKLWDARTNKEKADDFFYRNYTKHL